MIKYDDFFKHHEMHVRNLQFIFWNFSNLFIMTDNIIPNKSYRTSDKRNLCLTNRRFLWHYVFYQVEWLLSYPFFSFRRDQYRTRFNSFYVEARLWSEVIIATRIVM